MALLHSVEGRNAPPRVFYAPAGAAPRADFSRPDGRAFPARRFPGSRRRPPSTPSWSRPIRLVDGAESVCRGREAGDETLAFGARGAGTGRLGGIRPRTGSGAAGTAARS